MNKYTDFPEQPRIMTTKEGSEYFDNMVKLITEVDPQEIVAVNRSGFSYAMWIAQILKLPLGAYWPDKEKLISFTPNIKRIVFVDDNILQGSTYIKTKSFMKNNMPNVDFRWAVLFSDWHTPENIRNEIIQGTRLPYFAQEPVWGSMKVSQDYGVRYRDEG